MSSSASWLRAGTVAAAIALIALITFVPPGTNDLWLNAAVGRMIWASGEIPRTLLFPFTEASRFPFAAHEWLSSVMLYSFFHLFGQTHLVFAKGLLGLALFGLSCRLAYRQSANLFATVLIALAAMAAAMRGVAPRLMAPPAARAAALVLIVACAGLAERYGNLYGGYPYHVVSHNFSPQLVEYLDCPEIRGNVLNSYELGAELIYRYYPRLRPAIDSRAYAYGRKYFLELLRLNSDKPALRAFIARYHVDYILLLQRDFDLGIRRMPDLRNDGWRAVFADGKVVLLGRPV